MLFRLGSYYKQVKNAPIRFTTDHNGFYFHAIQHAGATTGGNYNINFQVRYNGATTLVKTQNITTTNAELDSLNDSPTPLNFQTDALSYIKGKITDGSGTAIAGIPVVYTRGHWAVTDTTGTFKILCHNDSYVITRNTDIVIIEQNGLCVLDFGSDQYCYTTPISITQMNHNPNCAGNIFNSTTGISLFPQNCIGVSALAVSILFFNEHGLKSGGYYKWGAVFHDAALRSTYIQRYDGFDTYINSIPEKNSVGFPTITINFNNFYIPDWVWGVSFYRTKNLSINDTGVAIYNGYLQWALSSVRFIDDYGNTVSTVSATKVEIKIDGLSTFNSQNFNTTSTTYQFSVGDRIRFIANGGSGTIYNAGGGTPIIDLLVHSSDSVTFTIANNDALITAGNVLTNNAWIEFYHPTQTQQKIGRAHV